MIVDSGYIEKYIYGKWIYAKKELEYRYSKNYINVKIERVRSDTKGLYCYVVFGKKKESAN